MMKRALDEQIAAARALLAAHDYVVWDPEQQRQGAEFAAYRIYMSDVRAGKWGHLLAAVWLPHN